MNNSDVYQQLVDFIREDQHFTTRDQIYPLVWNFFATNGMYAYDLQLDDPYAPQSRKHRFLVTITKSVMILKSRHSVQLFCGRIESLDQFKLILSLVT